MHWLRVIGVLQIVALLQVTVLPALEVRGFRPDLLLLVALYIVVREPLQRRWRWHAFWVGWIGGLMADIYSSGSHLPLGSTALVFGLLAIVMSKLGEELFLGSAVAQVLILGAACLAAHGVLGVALIPLTRAPAGVMLRGVVWTAAYSGLAAPLVFAAMRPFERFLGIRSRRSFGRA